MQLQEGMLACSYYNQYKYLMIINAIEKSEILSSLLQCLPFLGFWQANALISWVPMHPMIQTSVGISVQKSPYFLQISCVGVPGIVRCF